MYIGIKERRKEYLCFIKKKAERLSKQQVLSIFVCTFKRVNIQRHIRYSTKNTLLTRLPRQTSLLQHVHDDVRLVHQPMVGTLHNPHHAPIFAHILLHPSHSILSNPLIPVTIPNLNSMRILGVRETPRFLFVVENLQQIRVCAFGRFRMRGGDEGVSE